MSMKVLKLKLKESRKKNQRGPRAEPSRPGRESIDNRAVSGIAGDRKRNQHNVRRKLTKKGSCFGGKQRGLASEGIGMADEKRTKQEEERDGLSANERRGTVKQIGGVAVSMGL